MDQRQFKVLLIAGLCAAGYVAFSPLLSAEFLDWDDRMNITERTEIRELSWASLKWMFFDYGPDIRYKPLTYLAWAILYAGWELNPFPFHLANCAMHLANAVLFFFLLIRLGKKAGGWPEEEGPAQNWRLAVAALVAGIWMVHPLRVEVAAWASVLSYSLAAFFLLVALLGFTDCRLDRPFFRQRGYWQALVCFQLAQMSFPTVIGGCFAFLACCVFPFRWIDVGKPFDAAGRRVLLAMGPFFVLTAAMVVVGLYGQHAVKGVFNPQSLTELPVAERLAGAAYFLAYYAWRPLYPFKHFTLNEDLVGMSTTDGRVLFAFALVIGVSAIVLWRRRASPAAFAVCLAFVGMTFPVLKLTGGTPFPGPGDRYALIPGLAWFAGLFGIMMKFSGHRHRGVLLFVLLGLGSAFIAQSRGRSATWRNNLAFFTEQVATLKSPHHLANAHARLGKALLQSNRPAEALPHFERSWEVYPETAAVVAAPYHARLLLGGGRASEAIQVFRDALDHRPDDVDLTRMLGEAQIATGAHEEGFRTFEDLIARHPDRADHHLHFAMALLKANAPDRAKSVLQRALKRFPNHRDATELLSFLERN